MKLGLVTALCCIVLVVGLYQLGVHESEKIDASTVMMPSGTPRGKALVYYDSPTFSVVYPPGSKVQIKKKSSNDDPPLLWTYYEGTMPNDARLVVAHLDIDMQRSPIDLNKLIDESYDNMFVPGYSIKKESSRLDALPAISAVALGFGQGSETVQCHQCIKYEAHMVLAWSKNQRRLWMLQTLAGQNELSSEEAIQFFNSFKLKE